MQTNSTLDTAQALHLQGRLAEAEILYREVLSRQPDAVPAWRDSVSWRISVDGPMRPRTCSRGAW